jgi:hypothetical protein
VTAWLTGPGLALAVGVVLALGALAFVLFPIFDDSGGGSPLRAPARRARAAPRPADTTPGAIAALREIEFDRATGKLSDDDYAALKATYTEQALAAMRAESANAAQDAGAAPDIDPVEAEIQKYRHRSLSCPTCGPRPEPDAIYCSTCGRYLDGRCAQCGATVDQPGAQFCASCGHRFAA